MTWNSTLKRSAPMRTKAPMSRSKAERKEGLGRKVEVVMGFYRPPGHKLPTLLRSEQHRRNVVALGCLVTGAPAQACHVNITKGTGLKACDSLCFPLSPELHRQHDQGGMPRAERWKREWEYVDATRAELMARGLWEPETELHYQRAVEPLRRLVNGA
ncbi:hypothetical protein [Achromobacter xylosoxidans]|uniref:hypothetical protein n=1 Tax=Alcaligenes xylosoxydans xylosoxydans TaxID=85698 RepID=UPI00244A8F9D|nr:hypothetical protein [Achromobacter xylosoxidans]MDH0520849.1 hypothetical protein [Achromobacter xylosoxidans]MDH0544821.1 hypothetical protein [Achromobacter xylosoxidans]